MNRFRVGLLVTLLAGGPLLLSIHWQAGDAAAQIQIRGQQGAHQWPMEEQDATVGVYLPSDRTLSRALARARERLAENEYHQTLTFLHGVLSREQDSFLDRTDGQREQLGLKSTARRLIGQLPTEGRDAYELLYGAAARRQLEAALRDRDQQGVANVVRQFYHTSAGYEAALVLAQFEADQGHRLAAAQLYQALIDAPRAADRFEPQLSLMAALNWMAAGQPEAAADTLRALIERSPADEVILSGQPHTLPAAEGDLVAWLGRFAGEPIQVASGERTNWLTLRGDPSRNTHQPGGRPHLRSRWQARVVNDPGIEAQLTARHDEYVERGVAAVPIAQPIAVGDVVIMRTPTNIIAIDWQTGKRVWETREDGALDSGEAASEFPQTFEQDHSAGQLSPWEKRIWDDALSASLSSDGQRVFILRGQTASDNEQAMAWHAVPGFGRRGPEPEPTSNQLAAFDLATQGKLLWELDGARAAGLLDGAFFLGAPLAIDNTLYVMAEIRSAIYLVALDPATGDVRWQQQLVGLELGIALDPQRRETAATPSYAGGILVCPTAAGAVVAIDVVKREFAWVYRYPRELHAAELRQVWQRPGQGQTIRSNDRWIDGTAVIDRRRVILAPPESAELHCLDLQTGKLQWKIRQGDGLFIGGIDQDHLLVICHDSVQAVRTGDGTLAWEQESVPLPSGALPAGRGYLSQGHYYLPLTTGEIAQIELGSGKLHTLPAAQPDAALGNLICHRGSVLSQSALVLDKFEQLDALQQRAQAALAENPDDPTALGELAELKRADGDTLQAVKLLKRAYELAPEDPVNQQMLAETLLEALAADYPSFRHEVPLVSELIRDRPQQIDLLRLQARGLEGLGEPVAACDAYLQLADLTRHEPAVLRIDASHRVRSDRWIAGRLATLWSAASSDDREAIERRLAERRPPLDEPRSAAELRDYLAHFDQLPGAGEVRHALAEHLLARGRVQEAELELLALRGESDPEIRTRAAELLDELALAASSPDESPTSQHRWPAGRVAVEPIPAAAGPTPERGGRPRVDRPGYRPLRIEQDGHPAAAPLQWFVSMDCSELVGRNRLGDDVLQLAVEQNSAPPQFRDSTLAYGARLGRLLFVALGGKIMAIDAHPESLGMEAAHLWEAGPPSQLASAVVRSGRGGSTAWRSRTRQPHRAVYHTWSARKRMSGVTAQVICSLGPVAPHGVVLQEGGELRCVDPLTGEVQWSRTDLPAGCELFGDDELVFAADADNRVVYAVRMVDGELLDRRKLPHWEWLLTAGRNVATLSAGTSHQQRVLSLVVTDAWSDDVLFEADYPIASRMTVVEPHAVAVYEPSGRFQLIDARTGERLVDDELAPLDELQSLYTMHAGDELYLFVSGKVQTQQYRSLGQPIDYPLINGLVYAYDMSSGAPRWPGPAVVRDRGVILSQPPDIPLLVFVERKTIRDAATGGGSRLRVLCLDKRTGQTVYRNDQLPDTAMSRFRIRAQREDEPRVALEMSAGTVQLTMTDHPRPPQPPANDDLEDPREFAERGLRGIGARMGAALRASVDETEEQ